ncbi:MAG: sugar-transfer associated ATP-grasp domain-containing protein [Haloarculaceae archaeon]
METGSGDPAAGDQENDQQRWSWLRHRIVPFVPLLLVATTLSVLGWLVGSVIWPGTVYGEATLFFQLVLAGTFMALVRSEIGLKTYGLFAPVVIAFIMVGAGPIWGVVLFLNVLVVTLAGRRALGPLQLGTAPRLAVLLSIAGIATALAYAASTAGHLPQIFGSQQVFFPTVITAWYADRAASDIEERGWRVPARRLLGTLVAVVGCYAVIVSDPLVSWFVSTPAVWGPLLLGVAYLGSRPGFRVLEYLRFDGHSDGKLGPVSIALVHAGHWWRATRCRLWRLLGREAAAPPSPTDVLGMKRRNRYIEAYNPPHLRPGADEKASINRRLNGLGIPSPETYAVVDSTADLSAAARIVDECETFVIKPSDGYGGEGIVVVTGRDGDTYDTSKGPMTPGELIAHVRRIVDGHYSGLDDDGAAIVEEKLTPSSFMRDLHGDGVADVRVVVFQGFPVMAMTRLPTEESDGAANLHLGAVGVGLSLTDGTPLGAYQQSRDRELDAHPDTGASLTDFRVPAWQRVLETAVEAAAASGLGYTGVDIVLCEGEVPKVLEVNVRPGLGIQNTTGKGLFERLAFVESLPSEFEFASAAEKIRLARWWDSVGFDFDPPEPNRSTTVPEAETVDAPDGSVDLRPVGGDGDEREEETGTATVAPRRWLWTAGGWAGTGALLGLAWLIGFPVLAGLVVLNAVLFVGWLCGKAFGIGDDPTEGVEERVTTG